MADDGIGASSRINAYLREHQPNVDLYRRHFRHGHALFVLSQSSRLDAEHAVRAYLDPRGKQEVSACHTAGYEYFCHHVLEFTKSIAYWSPFTWIEIARCAFFQFWQ